ncbi:cutinase [Mycobacteroides chelonae]|nr:cutinase [Mycobacteroides chelonae]
MAKVLPGWLFASVTVIAAVGSPVGVPYAIAGSACPDVEVVFARGTAEPVGIGRTGEAFVDALRARTDGKSVEVYPVAYPASVEVETMADGVVDASNRINELSVRCPETKVVLGGFSQGAAVIAYTTSRKIPADKSDNVVAVALFGKPSSRVVQKIGVDVPPITVDHRYAGRTVEMCVPQDPICSPDGSDSDAHNSYPDIGMTDQAADFAARAINCSVKSLHAS